jgi:hypothetical protein
MLILEAPPRFELGIKALQASALPLGYGATWSGRRDSNSRRSPWQGDALPLSHSRAYWWLEQESNQRHEDFQSSALPTELSSQFIVLSFNGDPEGTRTLDLRRDRPAL